MCKDGLSPKECSSSKPLSLERGESVGRFVCKERKQK